MAANLDRVHAGVTWTFVQFFRAGPGPTMPAGPAPGRGPRMLSLAGLLLALYMPLFNLSNVVGQ